MPLYEYQCDACGFRFEVIQRFSDPPIENCQSCGGPVRKLLSSPAIQFKGSGWYVTDYARKSPGKEGAGKEGGREGGEAKDSGTGKDNAASKETSGAKESSSSATKTSDKT
jgi:putative FmdB family regulatory protein